MSRRQVEVTPELLMRAYRYGLFPMAETRAAERLFWLDPERRPDSSARLVGQDLGRAHDRAGRDGKPSGELLVGEGPEDGCVPDE